MSSIGENITKNKIFWWIVVGIVIFIVLYIWIKLMNKYKPKSSLTDKIVVEKSKLSYPENQYKLFADQIYTAMEGAGTDEESILSVIYKMKNADDWNMLIKAYGERKLTIFWITSHTGILPGALRSELGAKDIQKINNHLSTFGESI
jgi:hypothetical protein